MRSDLSIAMWNINGLFHKVIGDKSKNIDFVNSIKSNDLILLTKTWSQTNLNLPGYRTINSIKTAKAGQMSRLSGGITLLFNSKLEKHISVIKNSQNFIWCKISKSNNDLYLCGLYIPPETSKYFEPELFDKLQEDTITFSGKGNVLLIGDFNAIIDFNAIFNDIKDFIVPDGNKYIKNLSPDIYHKSIRENFDNKINNHGKRLIEICKNCNLRILKVLLQRIFRSSFF